MEVCVPVCTERGAPSETLYSSQWRTRASLFLQQRPLLPEAVKQSREGAWCPLSYAEGWSLYAEQVW